MNIKEQVIEALKTVMDPEVPVNIWELGLVYDIKTDGGMVKIDMTMTSPTCPMADDIMEMAREKILAIPSVAGADINLVWEPAWDLSKMSPAAKAELDLVGMGW
jgi:metal-sulfur cluster biosynthetic enzyme